MIKDRDVSTILERRDIKPLQKLVLLDILARQPEPEKQTTIETGVTQVVQKPAFVALEQIAERTGISRSGVQQAIRKLRAKKLLQGPKSRGRVANRYYVTLNPIKAKEPDTPETT